MSHPRWSQTSEIVGSGDRVPTQIYNGYGAEVAALYVGMFPNDTGAIPLEIGTKWLAHKPGADLLSDRSAFIQGHKRPGW